MKFHPALLALLTATLGAATSTFAAEASTERTYPQDTNPACRDRDSNPCVLDDGQRPRARDRRRVQTGRPGRAGTDEPPGYGIVRARGRAQRRRLALTQ
ncbi:MAG: hypothetical protein ACREUW_15150 [Burkholderiales bacterium]